MVFYDLIIIMIAYASLANQIKKRNALHVPVIFQRLYWHIPNVKKSKQESWLTQTDKAEPDKMVVWFHRRNRTLKLTEDCPDCQSHWPELRFDSQLLLLQLLQAPAAFVEGSILWTSSSEED